MKECKYENLIDDYLYDRLSSDKKDLFEEHYFNCPSCFEKVEGRHVMISAIKIHGDSIFQDVTPAEDTRRSVFARWTALFTPRQWGLAALAACALLIVFVGIVPHSPSTNSSFVLDSQELRGRSLALLSPVGTTQAVPAEFTWTNLGEEFEYRFFLYEQDLLWSTAVSEPAIRLPEEVRSLLRAGKAYFWEVKAYSREGLLIAASDKVRFQIESHL